MTPQTLLPCPQTFPILIQLVAVARKVPSSSRVSAAWTKRIQVLNGLWKVVQLMAMAHPDASMSAACKHILQLADAAYLGFVCCIKANIIEVSRPLSPRREFQFNAIPNCCIKMRKYLSSLRGRGEEMLLESFQSLTAAWLLAGNFVLLLKHLLSGGSVVVHSIHNNVRCMLCVSGDKHSWLRKSSLRLERSLFDNFRSNFCAFFWSVYTKSLLTHECRLAKTFKSPGWKKSEVLKFLWKVKYFKDIPPCIPVAALINSNDSRFRS